MAGFTRDVIRVLKDHDCYYVRACKGDHEIWHSPITGTNFPVDADIKSRHSANEIMKQAGINHKF